MSEILLVCSVYIYQSAFAFSMVLLTLALLGKVLSSAMEIQAKKEQSEAGKELTKNLVDNLMNAITLSGIANGSNGKKGFH